MSDAIPCECGGSSGSHRFLIGRRRRADDRSLGAGEVWCPRQNTIVGFGRADNVAAEDGRAGGDSTSPHAKPKRRSFTTAYKLSNLKKLDAASERGAVGVILRQEGLRSSRLTEWRRWRDGINRGDPAVKKKPAGVGRAEHEKLIRENARLQKKLDQAHMLSELQKN